MGTWRVSASEFTVMARAEERSRRAVQLRSRMCVLVSVVSDSWREESRKKLLRL